MLTGLQKTRLQMLVQSEIQRQLDEFLEASSLYGFCDRLVDLRLLYDEVKALRTLEDECAPLPAPPEAVPQSAPGPDSEPPPASGGGALESSDTDFEIPF